MLVCKTGVRVAEAEDQVALDVGDAGTSTDLLRLVEVLGPGVVLAMLSL